MAIIDASSQGTYLSPQSGISYTYYLDSDTPSHFYVLAPPTFSLNPNPVFRLTQYNDATDGTFVNGTLQLGVQLPAPPLDVQTAIANILAPKTGQQMIYQGIPVTDLGTGVEQNSVILSFASADGMVSRTVSTLPSLSGSNNAILSVPDLSAAEMAFLKQYFGGDASAGTVSVAYALTVIAHMGGVQAQIAFDASLAYEYQRQFKWVS